VTPQHRGLIPPPVQQRLTAAMAAAEQADEELRTAVADALKAGGSVREVAAFTGMSTNTIARWGRERDWPTAEQKAARAAGREKRDEWHAQIETPFRLIGHVNLGDDQEQ
jgi:hypothetical protein